MRKHAWLSFLLYPMLFFCCSCVSNQPKISDIQRDFTDVSYRFETYQQTQEEAQKRQQLALSQIREMVDQESKAIRSEPNVIQPQNPSVSQSPDTVNAPPSSPALPSVPPSSPIPLTDAADQSAVKELFQKAMGKYEKRQYDSAAEDFLLVYTNAKDDDLKAVSLFWAGESYFQKRQWDNAIQCYMRVQSRFPNHRIVPAALLKEGYAYLNDNNIADGKAILKKLVSTFPSTTEAAQASDSLRALNAL